MTIIAAEDTRNAAWASDKSSFGQRMLAKMGWSEGKGLGKSQQGQTHNLRAIRREESLGIGATTDTHGSEGFSQTSANFHGVLAKLNAKHGSSSDSGSDSSGSGSGKKKKKSKKGKKRSSSSEKDASVRKKKHRGKREKDEKMSSSSRKRKLSRKGSTGSITLAQNRVAAGHARKMREAKDLTSKSAADMAAVFGVKVEHYKPVGVAIGGTSSSSKDEGKKGKSKKKKKSKDKKKRRREESSSDADVDADGAGSSSGLEDKKEKKKKKKARRDE